MKQNHNTDLVRRSPSLLLISGALVLLAFSLASCSSLNTGQDPSVRETQIELNVRETIAAQQVGRENPTATSDSPDSTPQTPISIPTQAHTPTLSTPELIAPSETTQPNQEVEPTDNTPDKPPGDFESWMKSANILLYEDMVNNNNTNRYVKDTLKGMGIECSQKGDLPCKDVGSAQGWFREDLEKGSIDGKPWDLLIVSSEHKGGVTELKSSLPTDFFGLVLRAIDQGIPVILEVGDLDKAFTTTARELLERCGVNFESNWIKIPPSRMVMFPLVENHPLLQEPNGDLSFSNVTDLWTTKVKRQYYDIGDLLKLTPGGNATFLLGTTASETTAHGTLTSCIDGMLLMQTFSSHQLNFNSMKLVWENYISNQLKQRYETLQ